MTNTKIRIAMIESGLKQWEVAERLNVSESQLSKMLRKELPEERQDEIVSVIKGEK